MFASAILLIAQLGVGLPAAQPPDASGRGLRVNAPPALVSANAHSGSRLLFLNRCVGGCLVEPGFEDSRSNHSSIIDGPRSLSEWPYSDDEWQEMLACVRGLYAPFDIQVTDIDPGQESHFEAMVAGTPVEAGFLRAGGVAPFSCGVIENAITYTFPAVFTTMTQICNVVGQESAHAFGLDHEMECADPLTYLGGCPIKAFQDVDAPCGEFVERECACGGDTQNSFAAIESLFGPGLVPQVTITEPASGAAVELGFAIRAQAVDDHEVTRSELWIDGVYRDSRSEAPFDYVAPTTLSPGPHEIEVRVFDDRDQFGAEHIQIVQDPCLQTNECDFAFVCVGGQCVLGPGNSGGLGDSCVANSDCQNSTCARDRRGSFCSAYCDRDTASCPYGFACVSTVADELVCMPEKAPPGGGFCSGAGSGTGVTGAAGWGLLLLLWMPGVKRQATAPKARNTSACRSKR